MNTPALNFDTLEIIAKELERAGVPTKRAEAQTRVHAKVLHMVAEERLVTKQDLQAAMQHLETRIDSHFEEVNKRFSGHDDRFNEIDRRFSDIDKRFLRLENEIQNLSLKLTVRLGGIVVIGVAVLAALIKL